MKRKGLTLEQKKGLKGFLFITPWLFGFLFLFLRSIIQSICFVFSDVSMSENGVVMNFSGLENIKFALFTDTEFIPKVVEAIQTMLFQVPVIVIFSLFIAILLNQKFHGRFLARAIFFIPVIVTSGAVIQILKEAMTVNELQGSGQTYLFQSTVLVDFITNLGLGETLSNFFITLINSIFDILWKTGIQILLFLSGLQGISPSIYEAADVEGATSWEKFWKITFPLISPTTLVVCFYSMIDSFTDYANPVMQAVADLSGDTRLGPAAAFAWIYLLAVSVLIAIVLFLFSRITFYEK